MGWYYLQHSAQHLHDGHSSWEKTSVRSEETAAGKGEQSYSKEHGATGKPGLPAGSGKG